MTKLKKPFVNTFTSIESLICSILVSDREFDLSIPRHALLDKARPDPSAVVNEAKKHLEAEGINWRTWEPPQPLRINNHEVTANPDGSVRVGCTTVPRPTLEAILKMSSEAMAGDWPKYLMWGNGGNYHLKYRSESDGVWVHKSGAEHAAQEPYNFYSKTVKEQGEFGAPLTPLQAREILEAKG